MFSRGSGKNENVLRRTRATAYVHTVSEHAVYCKRFLPVFLSKCERPFTYEVYLGYRPPPMIGL